MICLITMLKINVENLYLKKTSLLSLHSRYIVEEYRMFFGKESKK